MYTWEQFQEEVKGRLSIDSLNPNEEYQGLIAKATLDGVVDLQNLVAGLREGHVTEYSAATGKKVGGGEFEFRLPAGMRRANQFFYKEAQVDAQCPSWYEGFALDGFATLPEAEGYYQKTGVSDPLDGIDVFGVGPTWFLNTEDTQYGVRVSKHSDGNYYPAFFSISGEDPLADPETPIPTGELYYLSNPLTEDTDAGPAYAPWLSDGAAVWKQASDDTIISMPEFDVGTTYYKDLKEIKYLAWGAFHESSNLSHVWSTPLPQGAGAFTVRVPFNSRHDRISLHWSGVKQSFDAADEVPFDNVCARAVAYYVKAELALGHKDKRMQSKEFERKYQEARRTLYLSYKEANELS